MNKMLEGIRVIDLSQAYSGPFAAMHLADHGAEVIKVEPLGGEQTRSWGPLKNGYSAYNAYYNRNKKGIALNLKTPEGKDVLTRLISTADVVLENFKAGTFAKLGFSYERLKEIKPDIIYAQITGFGTTGPDCSRACYDIVAQAESGLMSLNGFPGNDPVKVGPSVADGISGLYLDIGIAMALLHRERTGEGSHIDVAMLDSLFTMLEHAPLAYSIDGTIMGRSGNWAKSNAPWGQYKAKDGFFVVACGTNKLWQSFAKVMELDDLADDPAFDQPSKRLAQYEYLAERIQNVTGDLSLEEVVSRLQDAGVPYGRVKNIDQVMASSQLAARNMLWTIYQPGMDVDLTMPGTPIKVEGVDDSPYKAAPLVNEDAEEILVSAGYTMNEIHVLKQKSIID